MSALRGLERVARDRRHLVAAQVRCSTGFTQGVAVDGQAKLLVLSRATRAEIDTLRRETPGWWRTLGGPAAAARDAAKVGG